MKIWVVTIGWESPNSAYQWTQDYYFQTEDKAKLWYKRLSHNFKNKKFRFSTYKEVNVK